MSEYYINYHTGVTHEVKNASFNEALQVAVVGMSYTQKNVTVYNCTGEAVCVSKWIGERATVEDEILADFGDFGFYEAWEHV